MNVIHQRFCSTVDRSSHRLDLSCRLVLLFASGWLGLLQPGFGQTIEILLVPPNQTWRFNHADCLEGNGWTATNYVDTGGNWLSGTGGFAGGETRAEALLGVTTANLPAPNSGSRAGRAMYFRTQFQVAATNDLSLVFSNRLDDNAAFYLNGQLVQRVRLSANPILCTSFGEITPHANNDATDWDIFTLSPAQLAGVLVPGTNTLAVEVHQNNSTSSDLVFVTTLTGTRPDLTPPPTLRMPAQAPSFGYGFVNAFPGLNFQAPIAIASPPGETNRLFVLERAGRVTVITNLAAPNRTVFMDISSRVTGGCEEGALGLAFHPGYATNGYFFLFYSTTATTAVPGGTNSLHQRVSRFQTVPSGANSASSNTELVLITQRDEACNHNGGDLHFGPDGYLYVSLGDEGNQNDSFNNSQTIRKDFFSGILRLDVDKREGNLPPNPHPALMGATNYLVPVDNPWITESFVGDVLPGGTLRTEFWAVGLRNPWRMSFDPVTGWLWCGDVGGGAREEVDIITRGGNYGWAFREGFIAGPKANTGAATINPIFDYRHGSSGTNVGNSITGGVVYRGDRIPQLTGAYIFADFTSPGNVWALRYDGTNVTDFQQLFQDPGIGAFGDDPATGDVLAADLTEGIVKRLTYNTNVTIGPTLPPTLAQTGAFTNLAALTSATDPLTPNAGVVPYDINVPFWSDNARKSRWFFLPGTNQFGFQSEANWSFPTGAVWVKHFDLELTNGVPESARRLETRLLVRNATGVYGVTYRWGDSLTNAVLVADQGMDETFVVHDGGVVRTQVWRYPSRSECNTCHTPDGGFALGFNTGQLHRDFDYGAGPTNQLAALARAGYLANPPVNLNALRALSRADDETASVEWRVRSYLAVNCAQCHVRGGSSLGSWSAAITNATSAAGLIHGPVANNRGNPNARIVAPGSLTNSMLLTRISLRGLGQMPPLASSVLDHQSIALVSRWITNDLASHQTFAEWQLVAFGSTNSPSALPLADPDNDGASNQDEYLTGTNPNQTEDVWRVGIQQSLGGVELIWPRLANRSVEIQWTTNLTQPANWQFLNLPANRPFYPAVPGVGILADPDPAGATRFYRARITAP